MAGVIGEKIELGEVAYFDGNIVTYMHKRAADLPPAVGVLVEYDGDETAVPDAVKATLRRLRAAAARLQLQGADAGGQLTHRRQRGRGAAGLTQQRLHPQLGAQRLWHVAHQQQGPPCLVHALKEWDERQQAVHLAQVDQVKLVGRYACGGIVFVRGLG